MGLLHPGVRHKLGSNSSSCVSSSGFSSSVEFKYLHSLVQYEPGLLSQLGLPHPGRAHSDHGVVPGFGGGEGGDSGMGHSRMFGLNMVVLDGGIGMMPSSPRMVLTIG